MFAWTKLDDGASAVEYALLIAGIAAIVVIGVFGFGGFLSDLLSDSCGTIRDVVANGGTATDC